MMLYLYLLLFFYKIISSRLNIVLTLPYNRKVLEYNKTIQKETNCSNKIPISTNVGENIVQDDGK
jgi:hypothetical protein